MCNFNKGHSHCYCRTTDSQFAQKEGLEFEVAGSPIPGMSLAMGQWHPSLYLYKCIGGNDVMIYRFDQFVNESFKLRRMISSEFSFGFAARIALPLFPRPLSSLLTPQYLSVVARRLPRWAQLVCFNEPRFHTNHENKNPPTNARLKQRDLLTVSSLSLCCFVHCFVHWFVVDTNAFCATPTSLPLFVVWGWRNL